MIWNLIKQVISQYRKWKFIPATKNILYHWLNREKRKSFGDKNPDKTFYVIRSINDDSKLYIGAKHNLLANYFYVVSHLFYAEKMGWIPIVDEENYPVYNSIPEPINGSTNAWEYYFTQPSAYTLDEVYQSKNVVLSKRSWFGEYDMGYDVAKYYDTEILNEFGRMTDKIPLNDYAKEYIEEKYREYFPENEAVLGVSYRYGGHAKGCYRQGDGHPMQLEVEELLKIVKVTMADWKMEKIFLATDEETIIEEFGKEFGNKLIVLPRKRRRRGEESDRKKYNQLYDSEHVDATTIGYLTEMELLVRCTSFIGTITSGVRYVRVRNKMKYVYCNIINNGLLPNTKKR